MNACLVSEAQHIAPLLLFCIAHRDVREEIHKFLFVCDLVIKWLVDVNLKYTILH